MRSRFTVELTAVAVVAFVLYAQYHLPRLLPAQPDTPKAEPAKTPDDRAPRRRRHVDYPAPVEAFSESDGRWPDGLEVTTDLPAEYRKANISSKGLGCCVFRSTDHAAHYHNFPALYGLPEWMQSKGIPGGGDPDKLDKIIAAACKDRGVPVPDYVQHTGGDAAFLEKALAAGRMVCVTYDGRDTRYGQGKTIAHMVNLVELDKDNAVILDNNFVKAYYRMTRAEFLSRWNGGGKGWAVAFALPPPPPVPHNF